MSRFLDGLVCLAVIGIALGVLTWVTVPVVKTFWMDEPIVQASTVVHPRPKIHQVMPGDTVWSIYREYYAGHDWEEIRYKIGELNGLKNDMLRAYTVIKLPEVE